MPRFTFALSALIVLLSWSASAEAQDNPFASCKSKSVLARGQVPDANKMHLTGDVTIVCDDTSLGADEVIWDKDTGLFEAIGRVIFRQPDLIIFAERAAMNGKTKLGTFYVASGVASNGDPITPENPQGPLEPAVMFRGTEIARTALRTYQITDGQFTTCLQATPRWTMSGSSSTFVMDKRVFMRNIVLRVKDVPVFYLPAIYYPINKEGRASGFLLPSYGVSTLRGRSISNAFFWAIGRSHDATFFHDLYTKTGQGYGTEYRYRASAGSRGNGGFYLVNEHDVLGDDRETVIRAAHRAYNIDGDANQSLPGGFRLLGRMNYFTDVASQQIYQNVYDYSTRERAFNASLTGAIGRVRLSAIAEQRDIFSGEAQGQRAGRLPSVTLTLPDKTIGSSKVYVGATGEAAYFVRQDNITDPDTNRGLGRFDVNPTVRAPLSSLSFLTATGAASWRLTHWLETVDVNTGEQVPIALTRQLLETSAEVTGPVFSRVFLTPDNGYADRFMHRIEPSFSIKRTSAFKDYDRISKNDYAVDYLVGGVTTMNYRLTNRILAKRRQPGGTPGKPAPGITRDILSVDISQSYYTDALAALADPEYESTGQVQSSNKGTFSPIQVTAVARPGDSGSVRFRMDIDSKYRQARSVSVSGGLEAPLANIFASWSKRLVVEGLPGFDGTNGSHFLNAESTLRTRRDTIGGTYAINYDIDKNTMLQQRITAYYKSQCCGLSFDWQQIKTPLLSIPSDQRFNIAFTLAGIGSFSNPMGSFGGR